MYIIIALWIVWGIGVNLFSIIMNIVDNKNYPISIYFASIIPHFITLVIIFNSYKKLTTKVTGKVKRRFKKPVN